MRRNFRFFLGLIILGGLGLVAIMTWRTVTPPEAVNDSLQEPTTSADLKLDRVHYTETREGIKEWELEATSAQYFRGENVVLFDKVKATFFGRNGETYVLVAEKGKFNTQNKAIEAFDGIKLDSSDGYQMRTQRLTYEAERKKLHTSDPIEINGPRFHLKGIGLVVDLDRQRLKVLRQVATTFSPIGGAGFFRIGQETKEN